MTENGGDKPMTVSEQLKQAIQSQGTAYRAGKASGVAATVIQRFLNGERDLRLATADKLCAVLGLELRPVGKTRKRG
jgi:plasmid maintenance system antidote protein VapI